VIGDAGGCDASIATRWWDILISFGWHCLNWLVNWRLLTFRSIVYNRFLPLSSLSSSFFSCDVFFLHP
jgi:hypothetical protein